MADYKNENERWRPV